MEFFIEQYKIHIRRLIIMKKIKKQLIFFSFLFLLFFVFDISFFKPILYNQQLTVKAEEKEEVEIPEVSKNNSSSFSTSLKEGSQYNDSLGRLTFDGLYFNVDIEQYDYLELMTYDELLNIESWLSSLGFDFDNNNDALWIKQNFNKILQKAIDVGILRDIFRPNRLRWGGPTHPQMMSKIFDLLSLTQQNGIANYFGNVIVTYKSDGQDVVGNAKEALSVWALQPDIDESIKGTHYYIPYNSTSSSTGAYYKNNNGNYSRSARTRMEEHYSSALNAYWNNDMNNAIKYLGFSIHYLMDIGNTAHATGVSGTPHSSYETYTNEVLSNAIFHATTSTIGSLFGIFESDFATPINNLAYNACVGTINNGVSYRDAIATVRKGTDKTIFYDPIIKETLPVTEQYVAALLDQFYKDTTLSEQIPTERSKNVILTNKIYCLKNLETGYYADVKGWKTDSGTTVQQFSFSGDTNQMFRAVYNNVDASFGFEPLHAPGKRLSFDSDIFGNNIKAVIRNGSTTSDFQKFKPVYLGEGRYRIMTGVSEYDHSALGDRGAQYAEVLRVSPNSPSDGSMYNLRQELSHYEYNPDSYNHYWSLEEVVDLSNTITTHQRKFEENKIYKITTSSSSASYGNKTFVPTNSTENYFEIGYRTGTGSVNYKRQYESTSSTSSYTSYLSANRIYFIKVTNKDVRQYNQKFNEGDIYYPNLNLGTKQFMNIRFYVNAKQTFEIESSNKITFYTSTGAILPMTNRMVYNGNKYIYTVNFNANTDYNMHETYFIKVQGVLSAGNYVTDVRFKRIGFAY